jgi:CheY-like chemotaxis protein
MGMSEDFLPHLFEEFSRENNTTDNKIEGTGLGMPIVKRLVEFMEGTIEVQSKKDVGSTFIVTIPHKIAEESSIAEQTPAETDTTIFEGKRILLAEDNELNAEIATEILTEGGFKVEHAGDGREAVDMLLSKDAGYYDLILMDVQMPNLNGYEATKEIRDCGDDEKAKIPIIAMTANAFEEDKKDAYAAGMDGHLAKPVNVKELYRALARIFV